MPHRPAVPHRRRGHERALRPGGDPDLFDAPGRGRRWRRRRHRRGGRWAPAEMLCHNGSCLSLPAAVRANLVLLLWPSNLPAVGQAVPLWSDQSGQGNHAHALYPSAPPTSSPTASSSTRPNWAAGSSSPTVPRWTSARAISRSSRGRTLLQHERVSFFRKSDGARENSRQISIDWVLSSATDGPATRTAVNDTLVVTGMDLTQPSVGAYTLRRVTDHLELRLNGVVLGSADLPTAGLSTSNADDVFLGVYGLSGSPADSLAGGDRDPRSDWLRRSQSTAGLPADPLRAPPLNGTVRASLPPATGSWRDTWCPPRRRRLDVPVRSPRSRDPPRTRSRCRGTHPGRTGCPRRRAAAVASSLADRSDLGDAVRSQATPQQ